MQYVVTETPGGTTVQLTGGLCLAVGGNESEWVLPDGSRWCRPERSDTPGQTMLDHEQRFTRAVIIARIVARQRDPKDSLAELGYTKENDNATS